MTNSGSLSKEMSELIGRWRSRDEAEAYSSFSPSDAEFEAVKSVVKDVLIIVPPAAGACTYMSALLAVGLERFVAGPIYVVAGSLMAGTQRVFDSETTKDWSTVFSASNPSWDGHCWVVLGEWIIDVSVCRTAYSPKSPPALAQVVRSAFGTGRGAIIHKLEAAAEDGLRYEPRYILTANEVDVLAASAWKLFGAEPHASSTS